MIVLYKALNRLGILRLFNIKTYLKVGPKKVAIPLIKGLGLSHFNPSENWLVSLLNTIPLDSNLQVFDIGANIGQSLVKFKTVFPDSDYIGFEPNSNCVYYLNELIAANAYSNAVILPVAVSKSTSIQSLYYNSNTDSTATILEDFRPGRYAQGKKDTIVTIDLDSHFLKTFGSEIIMKIDIEGSEYLALQGMTKFLDINKPIIICEVLDTHSKHTMSAHQERMSTIERTLEKCNFEAFQIVQNEIDTNNTFLKPVTKFPLRIWDSTSRATNDYLFLHKDKKELIAKFIIK